MDNHNILILGNGFDLDLGLDTKYSDFAKSDYLPDFSQYPTSLLAERLIKEKENNLEWFNLEDILAGYIQSYIDISNRIEQYRIVYGPPDEIIFNVLCDHLSFFIMHKERDMINADSCAARLLSAVLKNSLFNKIYSFNYTDISVFAHKLGLIIPNDVDCINIHGKADTNSIVLGVSGGKRVPKEYRFLKKTHRPAYEGSDFLTDLNSANNIIMFGHSLGTQDYSYFKDFIEKLSERVNSSQRLVIITKDYNSANAIKNQIEEVGNIQDLTPILSNGSLRIIKTKDISKKSFENFLVQVSHFGKGEYRINFSEFHHNK